MLQQTYARTSPPPTIPQAGTFGTHTAPGPISPVPPDDPTPDVLQRTASIVLPGAATDVPAAALDSVPAGDGHGSDKSSQRAVQLTVGDLFPDVELPDQTNSPVRLSHFMRPSPLDERLGSGKDTDGNSCPAQRFTLLVR